jgi:uncharacterized repeat protein (TIGR01451 family)
MRIPFYTLLLSSFLMFTALRAGAQCTAYAGQDTLLNCIFPAMTLTGSTNVLAQNASYLWAGPGIVSGANTLHPAVNQPGLYTFKVTDTSNGCTATDQIIVIQPAPITADAGPDRLLDCITAIVTLTGSSNVPNQQVNYLWTGVGVVSGANTLHPVINTPGVYTLLVTDTYTGCTATDQMTVNILPPLTLDFSVTEITCSAPGSIHPIVGGIGGVSFAWGGPNIFVSTVQNPIISAPGTYTVTVTAINGCTVTGEASIYVAADPITGNVNLCTGSSTTLSATGGTTYLWSNGATTSTLPVNAAGMYAVTVTDATGCSATATTTVSVQDIGFQTANGPSGCSVASGTIEITPSGGAVPVYSYNWNNGTTTGNGTGISTTPFSINSLGAGDYQITITDGRGCTATGNTTVGLNLPILQSSLTLVSCDGIPNGGIDLTPTGGASPYAYQWSNSATSGSNSGLTAGTYTVVVTDAQGCTVSQTYTLTPSVLITANVTDPTCHGGGNGTIDITPGGGIAPYTYDWSMDGPDSPDNDPEDVAATGAGTFTVTVTDSNGCSGEKTIQVGQPDSLIVLPVTTNPSCHGIIDGSISLQVSGGTQTYVYAWSNLASTSGIDHLTTGSYSVTVTDGVGCTATATAAIAQPDSISLLAYGVSYGCGNNWIHAEATGGTPPFEYIWSNNAVVQDMFNQAEGSYTVTVSDNSGCTKTAIATVQQPISIVVQVSVAPVNCFGEPSGSITLTVTGGKPPFSYHWSNGLTNANLTSAMAGTYTVTVTDANGCTKTASATVSSPQPIVLTYAAIPDPPCSGSGTGDIFLTVTGGVAPYSFLWNGGISIQNLYQFPAGPYSIVVTDANGCSKQISSIIIPYIPALSITVPVFCDGKAVIQPTGGKPPYTYAWDTGAQGNTVALPPGMHTVTVTDAQSCTATSDIYFSPDPVPCTQINGVLTNDLNSNCLANAGEPGVSGWFVQATGPTGTYYGWSDSTGHYVIEVVTGTYSVMPAVPYGSPAIVCQTPVSVTLPSSGSIATANFQVRNIPSCPYMTVDITVPILRRCFASLYYVHYCNYGPVYATDVHVDVQLDPNLSILWTDVSYSDLGNNVYRFNLDTVGANSCGDFQIEVYVPCSVALGQTLCSEAIIYPDSACIPPNPLWGGAKLDLKARCGQDSLHFILKNTGYAPTTNALNYIVIEDGIMGLQHMTPPLAPGDSLIISVPANGSTWRVEAAQEPYAPGYSEPILSVEGCQGSSSSFTTGFLPQFPVNDSAPWVDIECSTVLGSYDPNDKRGFPVGYGSDHYVKPGTDIEYTIRFQNTGTDTAFHVIILDTLDAHLDPATVQPGAGSHPYTMKIRGDGILVFDFPNVMLPDSNINEPASHGFVKFRVSARKNTPLGTKVFNKAAIYFDFNDPIFTNTTQHKIGENFVLVGTTQALPAGYSAQVLPNPFESECLILLKGAPEAADYRLHLYNLNGVFMKTITSGRPQFRLPADDLSSGLYLFRIDQNNEPIGWGKVVLNRR